MVCPISRQHINGVVSERHHTVDITSVRPVLKERVDGPEDEVPSRVCPIKRPLDWLQARSGVLLKEVLV